MDVDALEEIAGKQYGVLPRWKEVLWDIVYEHKGVKLFPELHFRTEAYPSPDNLVNLEKYQAFIRVDQARNVRKFKTVLRHYGISSPYFSCRCRSILDVW